MRRYGAYQSYTLQPAFHAHHFSLILTPLSSSPPDTWRLYKDGFGVPAYFNLKFGSRVTTFFRLKSAACLLQRRFGGLGFQDLISFF